MKPLITIQLPCGLKELAAISDALGKIHGPALEARSSDDGTAMEFFRNETVKSDCQPLKEPTLWLSLPDPVSEQDAALLAALADGDAWTTDTQQALRFAEIGYTVKRKDRHLDGYYVETILPGSSLRTCLEHGIEMRGEPELNRPGLVKDEELPNLIMAGNIYCGCDAEEAAGDPLPFILVIQCNSAAQTRAALNTGTVRYTVFGSDKSQHQQRVEPPSPKCPTCGGNLERVRYPSGCYLNREQWDSQKAGDYFCRVCPDNGRANNKEFSYFWESEVTKS